LSTERIITKAKAKEKKEIYNFCASEGCLAITKDEAADAELNTLGVGDIFGELPS
jgi:hypothetical protein